MAAASFMFLVLFGGIFSFVLANICENDATNCEEISNNLPPPSCDDKNWDAPLKSCIADEVRKCSGSNRLIKSKRRLDLLQLLKEDFCSNADFQRNFGGKNLNCWRGISSCLLGIFTTVLPDDTTKRDPQSEKCQNFIGSLNLCIPSVQKACSSVEALSAKFINGMMKYSCCGEQKVPNCNRCSAPRCNTSKKITIHILVI
uniref:Saposin B-type domain-containing protein n=1 Tax=Strigamia maritima TaxID=126957 RepID=T1IW99_STRMM